MVVLRTVHLFLFLPFLPLLHSSSPIRDLRYVSYEDVHMDTKTQLFYHASVSTFLLPLFQPSYIIVAAKNHLLRLHTSNLSSIEMVPWEPDEEHKITCFNKGLEPEECHNFVKLLALEGRDTLISCGTYAHSPMCTWRNVSSLFQVHKSERGLGKCPHNRHSNSSFLLTSTGDLYSALTLDAAELDPAIVRTIGPSVPLRTDKSNSFWLDKPDFVGMFETEKHVYVFFREVAVEQISCGKLIVSRVARICKSDRGGTTWILKNNWTSFVKATLNCSRPGEYPFYYNEIQHVHYDKNTRVFSALFTTSPNSLYGSAVCEYTEDSITKVMAGNFKQYQAEQKAWKSKASHHGRKCPKEDAGSSNSSDSQRHSDIIAASQHQLADNAVQPMQIHPIIERPNERYNKLEVEVLKGRFQGKLCDLKIIYMASFEGLINKFVVIPHDNSSDKHHFRHHLRHHHTRKHRHHRRRHQPHPHPPNTKSSCLLESIQLLPNDLPQPITFLALNPSTRHLVVGTEGRLYQIPTHRCHKFLTQTACEGAQDPHCGWKNKECTRTTQPSISSCPLTHLIGKTWYGWSEWSECTVSCGEGIQMRMLICLENLNHFHHTNHLKNSLHCPGNNYVTRSCNRKACPDFSSSSWSPWLVHENKEERYRCLCQRGEEDHSCRAVLKRSERSCKNQSKCGMRLKRLVGRNTKKNRSHSNKRYSQFSKSTYNSRYAIKKRSDLHDYKNNNYNNSTNRIVITSLKRNDLKLNKQTQMVGSQAHSRLNNHVINTPLPSQTLNKATKAVAKSSNPTHCLPSLPAHLGIFYGYCGCRDMGVFRVCHKCSGSS